MTKKKLTDADIRRLLNAPGSLAYSCDYLEYLEEQATDPALRRECSRRWHFAYHRDEGDCI
jgi:hypothetical protein